MGDSSRRGTTMTLHAVTTPERMREVLMPTVWIIRAEICESVIIAFRWLFLGGKVRQRRDLGGRGGVE